MRELIVRPPELPIELEHIQAAASIRIERAEESVDILRLDTRHANRRQHPTKLPPTHRARAVRVPRAEDIPYAGGDVRLAERLDEVEEEGLWAATVDAYFVNR